MEGFETDDSGNHRPEFAVYRCDLVRTYGTLSKVSRAISRAGDRQ